MRDGHGMFGHWYLGAGGLQSLLWKAIRLQSFPPEAGLPRHRSLFWAAVFWTLAVVNSE